MHMHGDSIMAKKSKPSGKSESKPSGKAESLASVKEETIVSVEEGGKIDFFYLMSGAGVLIGIIYFIFIFVHFVFPIL